MVLNGFNVTSGTKDGLEFMLNEMCTYGSLCTKGFCFARTCTGHVDWHGKGYQTLTTPFPLPINSEMKPLHIVNIQQKQGQQQKYKTKYGIREKLLNAMLYRPYFTNPRATA